MKLSNEELKQAHRSFGSLPFINMSEDNVKFLKSVIGELMELRAKEHEREENVPLIRKKILKQQGEATYHMEKIRVMLARRVEEENVSIFYEHIKDVRDRMESILKLIEDEYQ